MELKATEPTERTRQTTDHVMLSIHPTGRSKGEVIRKMPYRKLPRRFIALCARITTTRCYRGASKASTTQHHIFHADLSGPRLRIVLLRNPRLVLDNPIAPGAASSRITVRLKPYYCAAQAVLLCASSRITVRLKPYYCAAQAVSLRASSPITGLRRECWLSTSP